MEFEFGTLSEILHQVLLDLGLRDPECLGCQLGLD